MSKKRNGFTLAEVLITLGIIGVIAAIVLPTTMTNHTYKTLGVKLGKFASQLENSARPFVIQNESFNSNNNYALVNTYLDESFLVKNIDELTTQEVELSDGTTQEQVMLLLLDGTPPERSSTDTGFADSGKFAENQANKLVLKDGTSIVVYPLEGYNAQEEIDPYKVGEVVFGVTFSPNVAGLPNTVQQTYDFVVTELGFVYPNAENDKCMQYIYKNDFNTNSAMFKSGMACALQSTNS